MLVILPVSLPAQDNAGAILRSNSGVLLNKNLAPAVTALYREDLIETQKNALARLETSGSAIDINPETMVTFEEDGLALDHGSLSVNTSRGVKVRVGCLIVIPANDAAWTHFDVSDQDGMVNVSALKSDVYIDSRPANLQQAKQSADSSRVTVREGEQKSRPEKCGAEEVKQSRRQAGVGAIMNSPYVIWTAVGVIVGGVCWALCRGDDALSPALP